MIKRLALTCALCCFPVWASATIEGYKAEIPRVFNQQVICDGIDSSISDVIDLPGNFWRSRLTLTQVNQGPRDWLHLHFFGQHLVPIDPGDPVPGPEISYFRKFEAKDGMNGHDIAIFFGVRSHGSGGDGIFAVDIAKVEPFEIPFWDHMSLGIHIRTSDIPIFLFLSLIDDFQEAVDGAATIVIRDNGTKKITLANLKGKSKEQVQSMKIIQGQIGSNGPVLANYGGGENWEDLGTAGTCFTQLEGDLTPLEQAALSSGDCHLKIELGPFPHQVIYGKVNVLNVQETAPMTSAQVVSGIPFGGDLGSLAESDDDHFYILCDESEPNAVLQTVTNLVYSSQPTLPMRVEFSSTHPNLVLQAKAWNHLTATYDLQFFSWAGLEDQTVDFAKNQLPFEYMTPAAGTTIFRLEGIPAEDLTAEDGYSVAFDQVVSYDWPLAQ